MDECAEVAMNLPMHPVPKSYDDALRIVRAQMPDESETAISNTAEALCVIHGLRIWGA